MMPRAKMRMLLPLFYASALRQQRALRAALAIIYVIMLLCYAIVVDTRQRRRF